MIPHGQPRRKELQPVAQPTALSIPNPNFGTILANRHRTDYTMKRSILSGLLTLSCLLSFTPVTIGQKHVYEDLLKLYVDEEYEKCLAKAENYTLNDATKKDPLPFLYMSMCLYEMSKIEKYTAMDEYKKADRDAMKFAEKYRKKDKNKEFFDNYGDYWEDLNTMAMEKGENLYDDNEFGKAKQVFDAMTGYHPENSGAWMYLALCQLKTNLVKEAQLSLKEFTKARGEQGAIGFLPEDQKKLLRNALVRYSVYLDSKSMRDSARSTLSIGADYFMKDAEFKSQYEELN